MTQLPRSLTTVTRFSKFLAMGLFILLPVLGYYLGMQHQKTLDEAKQSEFLKALVNQPTPTSIDSIASWKTYTNEKLGIEFRYPPQVTKKITEESDTSIYVDFNQDNQSNLWNFWVNTDRHERFIDYRSLKTCETVYKQIEQGDGRRFSCLDVGKNFGQSQDVDDVTLGGNLAKSFYITSTGRGGTSHVIQAINNPKIQIYINPAHENPSKDSVKLINQILSTFKFTTP